MKYHWQFELEEWMECKAQSEEACPFHDEGKEQHWEGRKPRWSGQYSSEEAYLTARAIKQSSAKQRWKAREAAKRDAVRETEDLAPEEKAVSEDLAREASHEDLDEMWKVWRDAANARVIDQQFLEALRAREAEAGSPVSLRRETVGSILKRAWGLKRSPRRGLFASLFPRTERVFHCCLWVFRRYDSLLTHLVK